jgi:hypothetical protein
MISGVTSFSSRAVDWLDGTDSVHQARWALNLAASA